MFTDVVVPLDFSRPCDAVLGVASAVARRARAGLRLVTVSSPFLDHTIDRAELQALAKKANAASVATEVIESNDVAPALLGAAGVDGLLCLQTRAKGPLSALVLGSTASDVLHTTTRPVLLVGPATNPDIPVDLVEVCVDRPDTAEALLPVVATWARGLGLRLRFVHASVAGQEPPGWRTKTTAELADLVRRAREDFGVEAGADVVTGRTVPEAIAVDATGHHASIIAVAVRRRSSRRHKALGSVAFALAHATDAAVLAVPVPAGA